MYLHTSYYNVFYDYSSQYHYLKSFHHSRLRYLKYEDSDWKINHLIYLLCDVSKLNIMINVFYRYFDQYHYFDRLEARFVKYDDSDSESKNIIYLLCDVPRS
jgi:hypothetical protein